jgi:DNA excision repair protein ERCC-2
MGVMRWFPYTPRPQQDRAVTHAAHVFQDKTVGLLSADCGVGKTIAVLSGYLAVRAKDASSRLIVLTRTHSQSKVFEDELGVLREEQAAMSAGFQLTATSMVSRGHVCPLTDKMNSVSSVGFLRACAQMIGAGKCSMYWSFYKRGSEGRPQIRDTARQTVDALLNEGVVTRDEAEDVGRSKGVCPYEVLRWCARKSRVVIGPYGYLFRERVRNALLSSLGMSLHEVDLIVDEAHNLASHVLGSETACVRLSDLEWLRKHDTEIERETQVEWLPEAVDFLWETVMTNLDNIHSEKNLEKWDVLPRFVDESQIQNLLLGIRIGLDESDGTVPTETPLDRLVEFLYTGHRAVQSEDWHVTLEVRKPWKQESNSRDADLKIRPLNAAGLSAPVLRGARSALLMSGTLRPLQHYADLLGVSGALMESLMSPYPHGSRLVLLDKDITTKYTARGEQLWRTIAGRISTALTAMPSEKSALIAFPSYRIMEDVLSYGIDCGFRARLEEAPGERIEIVKEALEEGPHTVFCVYGGKFSEGVDLVEGGSSMIDLIIGVGIPFSPPTSYQKALQGWYERRFGKGAGYYYSSIVPSFRMVAQLVGRLRRSPEDRGVVVLLDKRFQQHIRVFGDDMVSDHWPYSGEDEMRGAIDLFVRQRNRKEEAKGEVGV